MMRAARGYSLIEVLVAVLLFSLVATALAQTLVITGRARYASANWMRATQLAGERIEAVRAGIVADERPAVGIFRRETTVAPFAGHPGLTRIDVTVSWTDSEPKQFTLSTLVRR